MRVFATIGVAVGLMLCGAIARAESPTTAAVTQTCGVEVKRLCAGKTGAELRQCTRTSGNNLSSACKQALANANLKVKEIKSDAQQ